MNNHHPEDIPEMSAYERAKLDLKFNAAVNGVDEHTELERRVAEQGARVVSPRPEQKPTRIQRAVQAVLPKIIKKNSK